MSLSAKADNPLDHIPGLSVRDLRDSKQDFIFNLEIFNFGFFRVSGLDIRVSEFVSGGGVDFQASYLPLYGPVT